MASALSPRCSPTKVANVAWSAEENEWVMTSPTRSTCS
jgi:hypothetical protein